jgi:flagellar biosynthesis/type III secretory pathway protein FliH
MAGNPFQNPLGASAPAADGPARVVKGGGYKPAAMATFGQPPSAKETAAKPSPFSNPLAAAAGSPDWKGVPSHAMRGFPLRSFGGAARTGEDDGKLNELRVALHKSEESRRKAAEEAKDEMVQMAKAALAEGMEKGRVEGEAQALAKYQAQLAKLQKNAEATLAALAQEKAQVFLAFERMVIDLFNACLLKVFQNMPEWNDELVLAMLRQAVATLNAQASLTIRIHPQDFKVVQSKRHFWETLETAALEIRFEADERVARGGCLIEAGATSAGADPLLVAAQFAETVKQVHQGRIDALRREGDAASHG